MLYRDLPRRACSNFATTAIDAAAAMAPPLSICAGTKFMRPPGCVVYLSSSAPAIGGAVRVPGCKHPQETKAVVVSDDHPL